MDTAGLHALVPLAATLRLRVAAAAPEHVTLELDHRADLCTAGGVLHGGAIMAVADTAGALCAYLNLPEGATGTTTVESKTNLPAAVRGGTLTAAPPPPPLGAPPAPRAPRCTSAPGSSSSRPSCAATTAASRRRRPRRRRCSPPERVAG